MVLFSPKQKKRPVADTEGKRPRNQRLQLVPGEKEVTVTPVEGELFLTSHVSFNLNGRTFGAYLCSLKPGVYRLVFGFDCTGIHPNLSDEQVLPIYDKLVAGFKDVPEGEIVTFHSRSFTNDAERMQELVDRIESSPQDILKYIAASDGKRLQELTAAGVRKPKSLRVFCTYTYNPDADVDDAVESIGKSLYGMFAKFSGADKVAKSREFAEFLKDGANSFLQWERTLTTKMGLAVKPLSVQSLWADLWRRFNQTPAPDVPQIIHWHDGEVNEEVLTHTHPLSLVIKESTSLPRVDRNWINVAGNYIGVLTLESTPSQWPDYRSALNYIFSQTGDDRVTNTEIITQVVKVDQSKARQNLVDVTDEELHKAKNSAADGEINVAASINLEAAIEAQAELHRDGVAVAVSTTFLIHRPNLKELDTACADLSARFLSPAQLNREFTYTWMTWFQTFPVHWDTVLSRPFNRLHQAYTSWLPGYLPLTSVKGEDRQGLEMLTDRGGVPLYLDLVNGDYRVLWLAASRAGKSVAVTTQLNGVLANNIPVTIVDCPTTAEAATFKHYTELVNGAYLDVGTAKNNIFQIPNLAAFGEREREDRSRDYRDWLLNMLLTLVVGANLKAVDPDRKDRVKSILLLAINAFFNAREIQVRYQRAIECGLGTPEWQNYPCLGDFIAFCQPARLNLNDTADLQALNAIVTRLRSWQTSRIGECLSKPSSFNADAQLFTIAIRGVSNPDDMAVLAMVVQGIALRRAYSFPKSVFFLDEAAALLKYDALAIEIGKLCAVGAKASIRVMLAAQHPQTIAECAGGADILANCNAILIGRIESQAVDLFTDTLKLPLEIIAPNCSPSYFPDQTELYSQWLVSIKGQPYTPVRIYSSPGALAAIVNNTHEVARRKFHLERAPNPIAGIHDYAQELIQQTREKNDA
jgi:hypothetical protein